MSGSDAVKARDQLNLSPGQLVPRFIFLQISAMKPLGKEEC